MVMKPVKSSAEDVFEGQVIFTPSRNPYAVLPGFVKAWAVTDVVFAGLWCLCLLCLLALAIVLCIRMDGEMDDFLKIAWQWTTFASAMAGGLGLYANIHLLSRKPHGVRGARFLIGFTVFRMAADSFMLYGYAALLFRSPAAAVFCALIVFAGRTALLCFYWIAVARAAKYFAERRRLLGF